MANTASQAWLYRRRCAIKQDVRPLRLEKQQKSYLKWFLKNARKLLFSALLFTFLMVLFELALPLFTDLFISRYAVQLNLSALSISLGILGIMVLVYLCVSFLSIKYEKGFVITFLNDLRRQRVALTLKKSSFSLSSEQKGVLLSKISFHLSLVQMGLTNTLFPAFHWLLLTVGLIGISTFIDPRLLIVSLVMIPVCFLIFLAGYIVSCYYVSQDQTLYSWILCYISEVLDDFALMKLHHRENVTLKRLDEMVDIDSYFRVRRDLWLKFGNKILFVVLALVSAGFYVLQLYFPLFHFEHSLQLVVYLLVLGLLVKQLYLSLRIGLFAFPLRLGLALCVSTQFPVRDSKDNLFLNFKQLVFKAQKVKLGREGSYRKDLKYSFKQGEKVLIMGDEMSGKSSLALVLAAQETLLSGAPWIVKLDGERLQYRYWQERMRKVIFVSPRVRVTGTILDYLCEEKGERDIQKLLCELGKHAELEFLFRNPKTIGKKIDDVSFSFIEQGLIQMACALMNPPALLVIDHVWLDLDDSRLHAMILLLVRQLSATTFVCFSTAKNNLLNYDQTHSL
jgi:ABC-type bacteriocin/lantibiotic exporter with double-glycine peptidase domain